MTAMVIGLGGKLRAGKDEVAMHLEREHGFVRLGMSDALHEAMLAIDPIIYANFQWDAEWNFRRYSELVEAVGYVEAKKNPEVRRLLQRLGTEVGREMIGENVWVNLIARKVDDYLYADQPVVVTGIRFPNELQMIHSFAGRTAWVERPGIESPASAHASENGVSAVDFDVIVDNSGTLEDLYRKVSLQIAA